MSDAVAEVIGGVRVTDLARFGDSLRFDSTTVQKYFFCLN